MISSVGIIGYGRFGRVAARFLSKRAQVYVHDPALRSTNRLPHGARRATLAEASARPVVVLAVPISRLEALLSRIRSTVLPGALVCDVCSVKSLPVAWMKRLLPRSVKVIGTHPLFGPDSVTGSLKGHRIIVCPGRSTRGDLHTVCEALAAAGLAVEVMTPAAHDRLMAETLLLAQYIGRLPGAAGIPLHERTTPSYSYVKSLAAVAMNDTEQLFRDMWSYNPAGKGIARRIAAGHRRLLGKVTRRGR